jgi:alcohol dehydrogenase
MLAEIVEAGALKPLLDETQFGLEEVGKAHDRLTSGQAIGKVVVEIQGNARIGLLSQREVIDPGTSHRPA